MHSVRRESIAQWRSDFGPFWLPGAINEKCPHCHEKVSFRFEGYHQHDKIKTLSAPSACPSCTGEIGLWVIAPSEHKKTDKTDCQALFLYPPPRIDRLVDTTDLVDLPQEILADYQSAVNVFNIGEWNAAAVCCRRVMEGLAQSMLPEDQHRKPLYQQLQVLPQHKDLNKPILDLANALREGGNWGAHFTSGSRPDAVSAKLMIEFVEYFLEYLYGLPHKVAILKSAVDRKKTAGTDE